MRRSLLLTLSLAAVSMAANSFIGARTGGLWEQSQHATLRGMADAGHAKNETGGSDPLNPAAGSFASRVSFAATLGWDQFQSDLSSKYAADQLGLRQFQTNIPTPWFSLGLGFDQLSSHSMTVGDSLRSVEMHGGPSLISLAISSKIPGMSNLALGVNAGFVGGSSYENLRQQDSLNVLNRKSQDQYSGMAWTASLNWQDVDFAAYVGARMWQGLEMERKSIFVDSLNSKRKSIDGYALASNPPEILWTTGSAKLTDAVEINGGLTWQMGLQALSVDGGYGVQPLDINPWLKLVDPNGLDVVAGSTNGAAWRLSAGYRVGSSTRPFDPFWKKSALRLGLGHESYALQSATVDKVSLGFGVPLGNRGSRIDFAAETGLRTAQGVADEQFVGFTASLTGFGNWGQPSRRYR